VARQSQTGFGGWVDEFRSDPLESALDCGFRSLDGPLRNAFSPASRSCSSMKSSNCSLACIASSTLQGSMADERSFTTSATYERSFKTGAPDGQASATFSVTVEC